MFMSAGGAENAGKDNAGLENDGQELTYRKMTDNNIERTPYRIIYMGYQTTAYLFIALLITTATKFVRHFA